MSPHTRQRISMVQQMIAVADYEDLPPAHQQRDREHLLHGAFADVPHQGPGSREAGLATAFKLTRNAESRWRKLNGSAKLQELIDGIVFVDGERIAA